MIFLFVAGGLYVTESDEVGHEELKDHVQLDAAIANDQLKAEWEWAALPEGELEGEDYIGIIAYENGEVLPGYEFEENEIQLLQGDEVIYEDEAMVVDEGLIFEFPNRIEMNEVYGPIGSVSVQLPEKAEETEVHYLHTWLAHAGQGGEDPAFTDPPFPGMEDYDNFWWVVSETASE